MQVTRERDKLLLMANRREQQRLKSRSFRRSDCPLACALDVVGDRWTLLIVRDLAFGKSRYNEFLGAGEGITTNILAARLRHLEAAGLIRKTLYQKRPPRYEHQLTETGRSLGTAITALVKWANEQLPDTRRTRLR